MDANINFALPGVMNGTASTCMATTAIHHLPIALPIISLYGFGMAARNIYDLINTKGHKIEYTMSKDAVNDVYRKEINDIKSSKDLNVIGRKNVNRLVRFKRRVYTVPIQLDFYPCL